MRRAIESAKISTSEVDYINCHATSTVLGDKNELNAIDSLFDKQVHVSSIKGSIGHLLGAAGAVESIMCIESLLQVNLKELYRIKFHLPLI